MSKIFLIAIAFFILLVGLVFFLVADEKSIDSSTEEAPVQANQIITNNMQPLILESQAFQANSDIPTKYTCDGNQVSPPLSIFGVPNGTRSMALIVHDPDAPVSGGFTHWTVWNIDPAISGVSEGSVPAGAVEGLNGSSKKGYTGPCPPSGVHHYQFMLFALDAKLDLLAASTGKAELEQAMQGHILEQTTLVGLYQRSK
jgi:Raf kinase inhibitor-like YbhB/YbcL family protein